MNFSTVADKIDFALITPALPGGLAGFQTLNDTVAIVNTGGSQNTTQPTATVRVTTTSQLHTGETQAYSGRDFVYPGRKTRCQFTLQYDDQGDNTVAGEYYQGISQSVAGGGDPVTNMNSGCVVLGVQKVASVAAGNWKLFCVNVDSGGNYFITTVDTNVPVVNGRRYEAELNIQKGHAVAMIDGVIVASSFSNVPNDTANTNQGNSMCQLFYANGSSASLSQFTFEYLYTENFLS